MQFWYGDIVKYKTNITAPAARMSWICLSSPAQNSFILSINLSSVSALHEFHQTNSDSKQK